MFFILGSLEKTKFKKSEELSVMVCLSKPNLVKILDLNLKLRPEELNFDIFYKIAMTYENLLN